MKNVTLLTFKNEVENSSWSHACFESVGNTLKEMTKNQRSTMK